MMVDQEILMQLAAFEQEMNQLQQQMQLFDQQIVELQTLKQSLEELEKSKDKEIYANLGKNIFIRAEVKSKDLLVEVGNKTFIKKNIKETLKVADDQLGKIEKAKGKLLEKMQEMQENIQKVIMEAEKVKK